MRLTQSLFDPSEVRFVCYVDDPLAAIMGTEEERRTMAAIMIMVWTALVFKFAFEKKGQHDKKVTGVYGGECRL